MSKHKEKPTILGFKPSHQDWDKVCELVDYFQEKITIGTVNVSDVLKTAVDDLYKKHIDPGERKGEK